MVNRSRSTETSSSDIGIQSLSSLVELAPEDKDLIRSHQDVVVRHQRGDELISAEKASLRFLLDGWGARTRRLGDGRRQIFSFLIPGDLIGLAPPQPAGLCDVVAMTPGRTLQVESLRTLLAGGDAAHTPIARALAEANRVGEVHLLDHLVRLGSYSAYQATAHLLLELHARMQRVGMAHAGLFSLPLGQRTLAAALGLSAVHMNRVFKELRADGHIDHAAGWILLRDPQQLGLNVDFTASEAGPSAAC